MLSHTAFELCFLTNQVHCVGFIVRRVEFRAKDVRNESTPVPESPLYLRNWLSNGGKKLFAFLIEQTVFAHTSSFKPGKKEACRRYSLTYLVTVVIERPAERRHLFVLT